MYAGPCVYTIQIHCRSTAVVFSILSIFVHPIYLSIWNLCIERVQIEIKRKRKIETDNKLNGWATTIEHTGLSRLIVATAGVSPGTGVQFQRNGCAIPYLRHNDHQLRVPKCIVNYENDFRHFSTSFFGDDVSSATVSLQILHSNLVYVYEVERRAEIGQRLTCIT